MITANLTGRTPKPAARKPTSAAQQRAARRWATANLKAATPGDLRRAEAVLATHPDAASPGYSQARQALERVRGELAGRPTT